jgi:uncharacterized protein
VSGTDYVVEPLAVGWFCRNEECAVFNGDLKEFLLTCRTCGSPRPKKNEPLKDRGPWSHTRNGRSFYVLDPRVEDVCLDDVAHSLAYMNRWAGNVGTYSVAEHLVRASFACSPSDDQLAAYVGGNGEWGRWALRVFKLASCCHDAHEPYVTDLPRPMKLALRALERANRSSYDVIEERVQAVVCEALGTTMTLVHSAPVLHSDEVMLLTEHRDLMVGVGPGNTHVTPLVLDADVQPLDEKIVPWAPEVAKAKWIARYHELGGKLR